MSMSTVVEKAHQRFRFLRETREERAKENQRQSSTDFPPVFNKRLFIAKSNGIIITREARKILARNRECMELNACRRLNDHELRHMSYLVEVLSLIHHNLQYVKECLSYVVTYETHQARQYIDKLDREDCLSCFYIVTGRVEVTYDRISLDASVHVHERNLIYTHGPGEYLGLVSHEGEHRDLEPPSTMYTLEICEFIRVDRQRFHDTMEGLHSKYTQDKRSFINRHQLLKKLPTVDKERLIPGLVKQIYPANKVILRQGEIADSIHFVSSGRCQYFRKLYLKQTGKSELFKLGDIEEGDVFGGESVINGIPSSFTVSSAGIVTCYRINTMNFNMTARENLIHLIVKQPKVSIDDSEIRDRGSNWTVWQNFRRTKVVQLLKESGCNHLIKENVWLKRRRIHAGRPQTCHTPRRVLRLQSPQRSRSVPATFTQELPGIERRPEPPNNFEKSIDCTQVQDERIRQDDVIKDENDNTNDDGPRSCAIYEAYEKSKEDISISKFRMNCLRKILRGREEKRQRSKGHKYDLHSDETPRDDALANQILDLTIDKLRERYDLL